MVKIDNDHTASTNFMPAGSTRLIEGDAFTMHLATGSRLSAGNEPSTRVSRLPSTNQRMTSRIKRSAALQEQNAMYQTHPTLTSAVAEMRRQDLLTQAEQARRVQSARTGTDRTSRVTAVVAVARRQVGNALVRTGERVQGVSHAESAASTLPATGALRGAR